MINFDEYIRNGEPDKKAKASAWKTAIGLQAVDGLHTSDYLKNTATRHIEGDISMDEVKALINGYYQSKTIRTPNDEDTEEADKVSANIARILNEKSFSYSVTGFTSIHRRLFEGVFKFAGKIRNYDITKREWVLRGDTVLYANAEDLHRAIEYDLEQERQFDYSKVDPNGLVNHISQFVSGLWQIHPFGEGNTRTTAVFTILYLRSMGLNVTNDLFAHHSWYFRNALVRANYQNIQKGIMRDSEYLKRFFRNLLLGENNELRNRYMIVHAPEEWVTEQTQHETRTSTEQPTVQVTEQVRALLLALSDGQLPLKTLMEKVGLKHRPTFLGNYIAPSLEAGILKVLYPDKPNHPRQKYLLTVKGLALYNDLKKLPQ